MSLIVCKDREEWLQVRRERIGCSDICTLLGVSDPDAPWALTADELFEEKVGLREPKLRTAEVVEYAYWGQRHEPLLREEYEIRTGRDLQHPGDFTIVTNDQYPWFGVTVDVLAKHETLGWAPVQIKNVGFSQRSQWLKFTGRRTPPEKLTPREKWVQVQAEIFAYGAKWGGIAALIGGNTFEMREIERNDAFINEQILPAAIAFHARIAAYRAQESSHVR